MKKSLSLLLTFALVFGLFANLASAAETPASAGKYLQDAGVIKGDASGNLMEGSTWKRQDAIVLLSRLLGVEKEAASTPKSHKYADVKGTTYYDGYLSWALDKKYAVGYSATKFGFNELLTNQQFAAIVLRVFGVDTTTTEGYAKAIESAIQLKILPEGTDGKAQAKRGDTYVAIVAALNVEVPSTGKKLGEILNLPGFDKAYVANAAATGAKKVSVTFSKAVDTAKASVALKKDGVSVNVTKTTWDDAKKVVTLETPVALGAGSYTATASGIELATGKDSATFSVVAEKIGSIAIDDGAYRVAGNLTNATVDVKVLNQYGEEYTGINASDLVATPSTAGVTAVPTSTKVITLSNVDINKTTVGLTVVELKTGVSATKELQVRNVKTLAEITLSAPVIPTGKTTLEKGMTGIELPYVAKDQYGSEMKLTTLNGVVTFINSAEIAGITLNGDKLNIAIATFDGPKTASIQAIVNATGKSSKIEFAVNGDKQPAEVTLVAPTAKIGAGEQNVEIELQVKDQYGNALSADEIVAAYTASPSKLTIVGGNSSVFAVQNTAVKKSGTKAVVMLNAANKGSAVLNATVNATGKSSTITLTVVDSKYPVSVTLKPDFTKAVYDGTNGGKVVLKATFADQYGDEIKTFNGNLVTIELDNAGFLPNATTTTTIDALVAGIPFTANLKDKTTAVKVTLKDAAGAVLDVKTQNLVTAKDAEALTYVVEDLGTVVAYDVVEALNLNSDSYAKEIKISATDASGTKVAIPAASLRDALAGDDKDVVYQDEVSGKYFVIGNEAKEGDSKVFVNIAKANGDIVVVTAPVKVSKAAPVATKIEWKAGDDVVTAANVTNTGSLNFFTSGLGKVVVTDQYGTTELSGYVKLFVQKNAGGVQSYNSATYDLTTLVSTDKLKVTATFGDKSATIVYTVQ